MNKRLTKLFLPSALVAAFALFLSVDNLTFAQTGHESLKVLTYASPDPDSVNSHLIETNNGVIVIGAQRVFSEAERALVRIERIGKPVSAIFVTVPHTDNFGGLKIFADAFPNAPIYAAQATIDAMRNDVGGYIASRKDILGDDFPSLEVARNYLPDHIVEDGEVLTVDGVTIQVFNLPNNNAPVNTLLYLPQSEVLFSSEVVENAVTAFMRDADLANWLGQIEGIEQRFPNLQTIYGAHNFPGPANYVLTTQRTYLTTFRDLVQQALSGNSQVTSEERSAIVTEMERQYPDFQQVAKVERAALLAQNVDWIAERLAQP